MRPKPEILMDIIEASESYKAVADITDYIVMDDTDVPGFPEVLMAMKEQLYSLYREFLAAYKAEKECIDI